MRKKTSKKCIGQQPNPLLSTSKIKHQSPKTKPQQKIPTFPNNPNTNHQKLPSSTLNPPSPHPNHPKQTPKKTVTTKNKTKQHLLLLYLHPKPKNNKKEISKKSAKISITNSIATLQLSHKNKLLLINYHYNFFNSLNI
jgi:hypothetical protein